AALIGLAAALAAGAALRLAWADDVEYKADEAWTFVQARAAVATGDWPRFGMPTSVGASLPNPGLSVWLFVGLAHLPGTDTPQGLTRAVQLLNVLALLALAALAWRVVAPGEREAWLWALALAAVNPLAVLMQRKLWPTSALPLFTAAFLLGWW